MHPQSRVPVEFAPAVVSPISAVERRLFNLIIDAGRDCQWLSVASRVSLRTEDAQIHITIETDGHKVPYSYQHTDGWHYAFLRDLAGRGETH